MLRQVILFYNNEIIFSHHFAQAYNQETISLVLRTKLAGYIEKPAEGETFNKPLFDFQSHFGIFNDVFFVFVTDLSDRPKIIAKEIQRAAAMFQKYFPNPIEIKNPSAQKDEFVKFINETHYYLHPKISLMGPSPFDRQKIMNMLKTSSEPEKTIMNFAVYNQIQIGSLYLDLWNFTENDNFSPLWNNYIRGSDMILYVIDGGYTELDETQLKFFNNLRQREGKYSKATIFLTNSKSDTYITKEGLLSAYPFLERYDIFELDLTGSEGKDQLDAAMSKAIGLKQALPLEFKIKLQNANNLVTKQEYAEAIELLTQLIQICEEYQEFNFIDIFNKKIAELEVKLKEKQLQDTIDKKKIRAPEKISFGKFEGTAKLPGVKNLPGVKKLPGNENIPSILPKLKFSADNLKHAIDASKNGEAKNEGPKSEESTPISPDSPLPPLILSDISDEEPSISSNPFMTGMPSLELDSGFGMDEKKEPSISSNPFMTGMPSLELDSGFGMDEGEETSKTESSLPITEEKNAAEVDFSKDLEALLKDHEKINDLSTDFDFFEEIQAEHEESKMKMDSMPVGIKATTNGSNSSGIEEVDEDEPVAIPNIESGVPMDTFQIRNYSVNPIEISPPKQPTARERDNQISTPLKIPLSQQRKGVTRRKTLTFEKSPLIDEGERKRKADIKKTKDHSSVAEANPLQEFSHDISPLNPQIIMTPAEKLEQAILLRGDTLAMELCEKFVTQLQIKLKRTLNDGDIDNVAELYIKQKQKRTQS
ncbi:MAG: hypothetical protein ACTSYI_02230 [Promethearchaeota archaeon]